VGGAGWALDGKTAVVTGASSGLGREVAQALGDRGARLALVGRNRDRLERTATAITERGGASDVRIFVADLSAQSQVRRLSDALLADGAPIHVLVNNAGAVQGLRRKVSDDGCEMTLALNHLAYFMLTVLLHERLEGSAPARIVNVTGDAYKDAKGHFDFDDYNAERRYSPLRQYAYSKLANILFTRELARRLAGSGVTVNAAGPSRTTATRFAHNVHPLAKVSMVLAAPFLLSVRKGAAPIVHLCAAPDAADLTGSYWSGLRQPALEPAATDDDAARRLWELSTELTGVNF